MSKVGIVMLGMSGNVRSVEKILHLAGASTHLIHSPNDLNSVDKLIIPGVGSFSEAMKSLSTMNLIDSIKESISIQKKPVLGICLGMQIMAKVGYEFAQTSGLHLFNGEVISLDKQLTLPHMGFNTLALQHTSELMSGVDEHDTFYFMHSFKLVNYTNILSLTHYHGHEFVSSIAKDNLYGVQFHPEKSRESGLKIIKNFVNKV